MKYFVNYSGTKETFKDLEEQYYKYIVFIEGSDLIYTHGHYYGDLKDAFEALKVEISDSINMLKEQVNTTDTDLYNNIDSLSNNLADNVDKLAKMITSNTKSIQDQIDVLVNADASTAINTFNEIISFLEGIENSEDLDSIIASIEQQIANVNKSLEEHLAESQEIFITRSEVVDNYITKTEVIDNYATTETLNQAVQAVNSNINGVNQSINTTLQNVNEKANKAEASATDALNLIEGIQGNLSSFALKSELPTKVSQLENDVPYVIDDVVVKNGLYIYDTDGRFTLPENWNTANNKAVGVAIITDDCRFVVAKADLKISGWEDQSTDISTLTNYTDAASAATDFDGVNNTSKIIAALGSSNAAGNCAAYTFPNGKTGYLGAAGEWQVARQNKEDLNSALTLIGGTTIAEWSYWTSTEYSSYTAWGQLFDSSSDLDKINKGQYCNVRAFLAIEVSKPLKERVSEIESSVSNKQDVISDLEEIRQGAALGKSSIQSIPNNLSNFYNDAGFITGDIKYIKKVTALPDNPDPNTLYILI